MWNRTCIDFSQHILTTKIFKTDNWETIRVDEFYKPNTITNWLTFTNTSENLVVSWDFWNWVFCRPFIPSNNGEKISDPYWCEKLRNSSTQTAWEYDSDTSYEEVEKIIKELEENIEDYDDEDFYEIKDWWEDLLNHTENELEFLYHAYWYDWLRPENIDDEEIPNWKKWHFWLEVVFDAFEEMCSRLPVEKTNN